jgi:hypothetical protein
MEEKMKARGRGRDWEKWKEEAQREVEDVVKEVSAEPVPDPFEEDWRATVTEGAAEAMPEE